MSNQSPNQRLLEQFFNFYKIKLLNQKKGPRTGYHRFFTDPTNADYVTDARSEEDQCDYENTMIVEIGEESLTQLVFLHETIHDGSSRSSRDLARILLNRLIQEQNLRNNYPSVQSAWEHYSMMLHLASNGKTDD